jgi:hypothetical protein
LTALLFVFGAEIVSWLWTLVGLDKVFG